MGLFGLQSSINSAGERRAGMLILGVPVRYAWMNLLRTRQMMPSPPGPLTLFFWSQLHPTGKLIGYCPVSPGANPLNLAQSSSMSAALKPPIQIETSV
jgi:hypothetical protein